MKHIILDLGGVLIQLDWEGRMSELLGQSFDRQAILQFWQESVAVHAHETGQIDLNEFAYNFQQEMQLDKSVETIKTTFLGFVRQPYPGVTELLSKLKQSDNQCHLLSNISAAHFELLRARNDFFELFDHLFLSYKIGLMKPDKRIYQYVTDKLGAKPSDCVFFDDGKNNILAAAEYGWQSYQVNSAVEVAKRLGF